MAIIVRGKTRCGICEWVIGDDDELVSFPAFVANTNDPVWQYSDAPFHRTCFEGDPMASLVRQRYQEVVDRLGPGHRVCVVCGQPIVDPDEYFTFGHLTDMAVDPLHRLNYVQLHRSCIPKWKDLHEAIRLIDDFERTGRWGGGSLRQLLQELKAHAW